MANARFPLLATILLVGGSPMAAQPPANLSLSVGDSSPGGFVLPVTTLNSAWFTEISEPTEEAWLALNGDFVAIMSPGDGGNHLRIFDQDDGSEILSLGSTIYWPDSSFVSRMIRVDDDAILDIWTDGGAIELATDIDNDDDQSAIDIFTVSSNGSLAANNRLRLDGFGNLDIDGAFGTFGPELNLLFLRDEPMAPGELVRVSPRRPDEVLRSAAADSTGVVGVVSSAAGATLAGSVMSADKLREGWGSRIADRFASELASLRTEALATRADLQELALRTESLESFTASSSGVARPSALKPEDRVRLEDELERERVRLEGALESAALDLFVARTFVRVVIAGRAPVMVDASRGPIAIGDALTAGSSAGVATRATEPAMMVGVALEALPAGTGTIQALINPGWYGGGATRLADHRTETSEGGAELAQLQGQVLRLQRDRMELLDRMERLEGAVRALSTAIEPRLAAARSGSG